LIFIVHEFLGLIDMQINAVPIKNSCTDVPKASNYVPKLVYSLKNMSMNSL